jgi:hypothetical protein
MTASSTDGERLSGRLLSHGKHEKPWRHAEFGRPQGLPGGARRNRTADLLHAIQACHVTLAQRLRRWRQGGFTTEIHSTGRFANALPSIGVQPAHCSGPLAGKAAIAGWREIVVAAVREAQVAIWPFDGQLRDLLNKRSLVIAETYPVRLA